MKNQNKKNQKQAGTVDVVAEPARKCKICGGPNHYGCGCEAAAARAEQAERELAQGSAMNHDRGEPGPGPQLDPLSPEETAVAEKMYRRMTGINIDEGIETGQRFFETIENIGASLCDVVELLKTISANTSPAKRTVRLKSKAKKRR